MRVDALSSSLALCPYPHGMVNIDRGIEGNGYYPGARGFAAGTDPTNGIMLLGRDFGLYSYYVKRSRISNADETMYTWQRTVDCILEPLSGVGVWAVNYLLGARREPPATGNLRDLIPDEQWQPYEQFCWEFLGRAAILQKPRHIVVLGGSNHEDLTAANRLQTPSHTFRDGSQEHSARIHLAPHPSSLRPHIAREKARAWYKSLAQS
ncbi:Uracil DNA glycosylase superfamily protein [Granulicella rosea]|uniref:Uracil DNA glycosylase superfamily protein n=1 Tax=Granulicella rosea TaxID=474952 RepID=A0A239EXZ5_9BACT|nr:Uracil DNA glycosylase superfamily protein [Granulicella rosea]